MCTVQTKVGRSGKWKLPESADDRVCCLGCGLHIFIDETEAKFNIVRGRVKEGLPSLLPLAGFRTQAEKLRVQLRQLPRREASLLGADALGCVARFLSIALVFPRLDDTALRIQEVTVRRE